MTAALCADIGRPGSWGLSRVVVARNSAPVGCHADEPRSHRQRSWVPKPIMGQLFSSVSCNHFLVASQLAW